MHVIENWGHLVWICLKDVFLCYHWNNSLSYFPTLFIFLCIFLILFWCDVALVWANYTWQSRITIILIIWKSCWFKLGATVCNDFWLFFITFHIDCIMSYHFIIIFLAPLPFTLYLALSLTLLLSLFLTWTLLVLQDFFLRGLGTSYFLWCQNNGNIKK